jgi:membrane protein implicated in regulation of membrane protease activity
MRDAGIAALAGMGLALQLMLFGVVLLVLKFIWGKLRNKIGKTRDSKLDAKGKVKKENLVEETLYEQALNELESGGGGAQGNLGKSYLKNWWG